MSLRWLSSGSCTRKQVQSDWDLLAEGEKLHLPRMSNRIPTLGRAEGGTRQHSPVCWRRDAHQCNMCKEPSAVIGSQTVPVLLWIWRALCFCITNSNRTQMAFYSAKVTELSPRRRFEFTQRPRPLRGRRGDSDEPLNMIMRSQWASFNLWQRSRGCLFLLCASSSATRGKQRDAEQFIIQLTFSKSQESTRENNLWNVEVTHFPQKTFLLQSSLIWLGGLKGTLKK